MSCYRSGARATMPSTLSRDTGQGVRDHVEPSVMLLERHARKRRACWEHARCDLRGAARRSLQDASVRRRVRAVAVALADACAFNALARAATFFGAGAHERLGLDPAELVTGVINPDAPGSP